MRWKTLLTVITPVLLLAGCDSVPAEPETPQSTEPDFGATVSMNNYKAPLSPPRTLIACANDGIGEYASAVDPWLHVIIREVIDANGGSHWSFMTHPIGGWDYIGEITGDHYQATGLTRGIENTDAADLAPYTWTFVNSFKLIGPGPGNNYLVTMVTHLTWNANDVLTADVSNVSIECK
jgi:hypothetical protein